MTTNTAQSPVDTPYPMPSPATAEDQVTVPNLSVFDSVSEMKAVLNHAGLAGNFVVSNQSPPSKDKAFKFAGQDPAPDTKAAPGTTVTISIYPKYGATVIVPDLSVFDSVSEMKAVLNHPGLTGAFVAAAEKPPSKDREFKVAGQDPVPDTQVDPGSTVTVSIFQKFGEEAKGTVPNVVGLTFDQAQKTLSAAGLNVGGVTDLGKPPSGDKANKVAAQDPTAGETIPVNKLITLKQYGSLKSPKQEPSIPEPSGDADGFVGTWRGTRTISASSHPEDVRKTLSDKAQYVIAEKDGKPFVPSWPAEQQRYEGGRIICEFQNAYGLRRETFQLSDGKVTGERRVEISVGSGTVTAVEAKFVRVKLEKATGKVETGQPVRITSAIAQSGDKPARSGYPSCFAADPGAGITARSTHYDWAKQQDSARLDGNLSYKLGLLFQCPSLSNDQVASAFANISVVVAKYVSDASCFKGDRGATATDFSAHQGWARTRSRQDVLSNLQWKISSAIRCLDRNRQLAFFADVSVIIATSGQ